MTSQGAKPRTLVLIVFLLLVALAALGSPDSARAHEGPYWFDLQANDTDPPAAPGWCRTPVVKLTWHRAKSSRPFTKAEFVSGGETIAIPGSGKKLTGVITRFELNPPSDFELIKVEGRFFCADRKKPYVQDRSIEYDAVVPEFSMESFTWSRFECRVDGEFQDGGPVQIRILDSPYIVSAEPWPSPPLPISPMWLNTSRLQGEYPGPWHMEVNNDVYGAWWVEMDYSHAIWDSSTSWRLIWRWFFTDDAGNGREWEHSVIVPPHPED